MPHAIRIGVSACLLGQSVRYDGGHKRDAYIVDTLGRCVTFVPVCPEVEAGFGVPREPMRLTGDPESPCMVAIKTRRDLTGRMREFAERRVAELADENLAGYLFKAKSPSCGFARTKVYTDKGVPVPRGVGLFARAFMDRFPLIPAEDEGRLHDPGLRESFVERIFTLARFRAAVNGSGQSLPARLIAFTASHKLLLMAHSPQLARQIGRLTADMAKRPAADVLAAYEALLMQTLGRAATPAKHTNVLQHIMGYFKKVLSADEKAELLEAITAYRQGSLPRLVPMTLLAHYARKYQTAYLLQQAYLSPHPLELTLTNHA